MNAPSRRPNGPLRRMPLLAALLVGLGAASAEDRKYQPVRVALGVKGLTIPDTRDALVKALKALDAVETATTEVEKATVQVRAEKTLHLSDLTRVVKSLSTAEKLLDVDRDALRLVGRCRITLSGLPAREKEPAGDGDPAKAGTPGQPAPPAPPREGAGPADSGKTPADGTGKEPPAKEPGDAKEDARDAKKPPEGPTDAELIAALKSAPNVVKAEGTAPTFGVEFDGSKGATVGEVAAALQTALGVKAGAVVPRIANVSWTGPRRPADRKPPGRTGSGSGGGGG